MANPRLPGFLDAINSDVLVYSCGERLLDSLKKSNRNTQPKFFYTCDDGAIIVTTDGKGKIETATSMRK